ncbi:unnamed protein product [Allacma fusca]|uniref:Scavenger receptor class B member 1 n=1 Tax=Allacma fusca TaxID=39272 RepID=A0A8J2K3W0_9HEXA|nr:unnamed protein product [Allacma fusca]
MNKILILLAAATCALAGSQTQDFAARLSDYHDESGHGDRMMLCSEMPGERKLQVTFFSLNNAQEFLTGANNANLKEITPVEFQETKKRKNCSMNVDDMAINYGLKRSWTRLNGDMSQTVNVPNVPFLRIGHAYCDTDHDATECIPSLVSAGEGYIKEGKSVSEVFYQGVDISSYQKVIAETPALKRELPELEQSTFSILNELNYPNKYTLNSDSDSYGKIMLMDDQSELMWWKSSSSDAICSQFPGTTGDLMFPGKITEQSVLHFYSEDTCTTATLKFANKDTSFGFNALKFVLYPLESQGHTSSCYCTDGNCLPQGAINVKNCQRGLPYIMSYPHFYDGDNSYRQNLVGMSPDEAKHQSYFIIEPVTGMIIESSQKYQVNVDVKPFAHPDQGLVGGFKDSIVPLYWFNKQFKLDETHIKAIKAMLENPSTGTTSPTTVKPVVGDDSETLAEVQQKLRDIWTQIHVMSVVVFTFIVLAVLVLAGFSIVQFRESKKRRNAPVLPAYAAYETKQ